MAEFHPTDKEPKTPTARIIAWSLTVIGVALSLFQLYTAGMVAMTAMRHRSVFLTCILAMTFLTKPLYRGARKDKLNAAMIVDLILIAMAVFIGLYIFIDLQGIFERQGDWSPWDFRVGVALVLLVLEATRRVIGLNLTVIAIMFLLFGYFGPWMPELIVHKGYSVERIATTLSLTTEGIFGLPLGVASTFVFIFILFGAFLDKTGAGKFFIDLSYSITGRFSGGPAKTAVVASGFMGSVAGSAVANVVATGSFTIPMMKKIGYRPHVAAAVEAGVAQQNAATAGKHWLISFEDLKEALDPNASAEDKALATQVQAESVKIANLLVAAGSTLVGAAGGEDEDAAGAGGEDVAVAVDQEVVQHHVVQGDDPGPPQRQLEHALVVGIVAHLVEGQTVVLAAELLGDRPPALGHRIGDLLTAQPDDPEVTERLQVGQQVEAVVGDARAHRRQRRDVVQPQPAAGAGRAAHAGLSSPIWLSSQASMNGSMSEAFTSPSPLMSFTQMK